VRSSSSSGFVGIFTDWFPQAASPGLAAVCTFRQSWALCPRSSGANAKSLQAVRIRLELPCRHVRFSKVSPDSILYSRPALFAEFRRPLFYHCRKWTLTLDGGQKRRQTAPQTAFLVEPEVTWDTFRVSLMTGSTS
jgi:hypothetical protein